MAYSLEFRRPAVKMTLRWICPALLCAALFACAAPAPKPAATPSSPHAAVSGNAAPPLILVSIDGFRNDYLDRGVTPRLSEFAAQGARVTGMRPVFPSLTFPNHYSIVTGLYPDHHGITHNRMIDPASNERFVYNDPHTTIDPKWWSGEPLWVTVEKAGRHAGTMFWPGSDVAIGGVQPTHWLTYDGNITPEQRVDTLLSWFDAPPTLQPAFSTIYFDAVDHAGHVYGPDTPEVNEELGRMDTVFGRLLDGLAVRGLAGKVNLLVVSDHGAAATSPSRIVWLDEVVDMAKVELITTGVLTTFNPVPSERAAVEKAVLAPREHMHCWRKSEVPAELHYGSHPHVPELLCLADVGWVVNTHGEFLKKGGKMSLGEHGYDNRAPEMRALCIAAGPGIKPGARVEQIDNIDLYPAMLKLLGLPPRPSDADPKAALPLLRNSN